MGHRDTSCDPHLHQAIEQPNAPVPHAKRPPPGGYVQTRYSLKCQSSWRALASTATRIIERPARRDGERLRGKIAFAELPNGIDDRWLANPTPCGIRKNKDQPFRSHNAESRTEHPAFAKQSSLVDETGIEPATSSLRTVGKIS